MKSDTGPMHTLYGKWISAIKVTHGVRMDTGEDTWLLN